MDLLNLYIIQPSNEPFFSRDLKFDAMTILLILFATFLQLSNSSKCGNLTLPGEEEASHFVRYVGSKPRLAPQTELEDPGLAVILRGRVLDRRCLPVPGAVLDVWYAGAGAGQGEGGASGSYTLRPQDLLYRGQALTNKVGSDKF